MTVRACWREMTMKLLFVPCSLSSKNYVVVVVSVDRDGVLGVHHHAFFVAPIEIVRHRITSWFDAISHDEDGCSQELTS
jgi:hypothetical protein